MAGKLVAPRFIGVCVYHQTFISHHDCKIELEESNLAKALARRHAQAIFQIALQQKTLDTWRSDLKKLAQVLADEQVKHFWDNPRVRLDKKMAILKSLLEDVNPLVLNLAGLLMARGRLGIANDLVNEYECLVASGRGPC